jgi:GNAT superfamily N-acetyltransferase
MAKKTVVQLTDDLDGTRISGAGETVKFALDGIGYEIDLSEKNAGRLRDLLQPYVAAARRGHGGGARSSRSSTPTSTRDAQAIRDWARHNGYEVSERGRISATVLGAYEAATTES